MTSKRLFKPKILGFLCNWCCYAAADSAGISRFQYPSNIRVIRIMCTGRMDPVFVTEAFLSGADGLFVGGWQLGECHYQFGNFDALVFEHFSRTLLIEAGIHPERFTLDWASAAEAPLYVELITNFTKKISKLGPLGETDGKSTEEIKKKLIAAKSVAANRKLRTRLGKLTQDLRQSKDYSPQFLDAKCSEKFNNAISREMEKCG